MKKAISIVMIFLLISSAFSQNNGLKVFISVDMEGISGVVNWEEVSRTGKDYELFRRIMTEETNAAIEGAIAGGATEVVVRDSHGSARNILPDKLDKRAVLIRDWSGYPEAMMDGIDDSFDAVIFVGYHAMAGTPDATLDHTNSSSNINESSINGIDLPDAGWNALIAGYHDVPVCFVTGDQAICDQVKELFGKVETVATKRGYGNAAICLHPDVAHDRIRKGIEKSLKELNKYKPYKLQAPYKLELRLFQEKLALDAAQFPGVKRKDAWTVQYTGDDLMEVIKVFRWLY